MSQVVVPFADGMTITTADVVANVEVRAKSLAAGACGVTYETFGGEAGFLAPPFTFSPWTTLVAHVGVASFTISETVKCDVGVIAEIRYYK